MFENFVRVATAAPEIRVADPMYNAGQLIAAAKRAAEAGVQILVLPELMLTGSTAGDLYLYDSLQLAAEKAGLWCKWRSRTRTYCLLHWSVNAVRS